MSKHLGFVELYRDVSVLEGDGQEVICFPYLNFQPDPKVIYGGKTAMLWLCHCLWVEHSRYARQTFKFDKADLEKQFLALTGASMSLFTSLSLDVFPPNHPFHSNGAIELLKIHFQRRAFFDLSFRVNAEGKFDPPVGFKNYTTNCFLGAPHTSTHILWDELRVIYSPNATVEEMLSQKGAPFTVAQDVGSSVWVTRKTLREILLFPK